MNWIKRLFGKKEETKKCDIHVVMCRFLFKYKCLDEDYSVELEADNLNKAMFNFATYYHQIQEVYSITEVS